jgi:hypothetical protein
MGSEKHSSLLLKKGKLTTKEFYHVGSCRIISLKNYLYPFPRKTKKKLSDFFVSKGGGG